MTHKVHNVNNIDWCELHSVFIVICPDRNDSLDNDDDGDDEIGSVSLINQGQEMNYDIISILITGRTPVDNVYVRHSDGDNDSIVRASYVMLPVNNKIFPGSFWWPCDRCTLSMSQRFCVVNVIYLKHFIVNYILLSERQHHKHEAL